MIQIESEHAFKSILLYSSNEPLLHLDLYIVNSKGRPFFRSEEDLLISDQNSYIEDLKSISFYVHALDPSSKTIDLKPWPKTSNTNSTSSVELERRGHLSRMEWILKGNLRSNLGSKTIKSKGAQVFTLVSVDAQLDKDEITNSLNTFEMQLIYSVSDNADDDDVYQSKCSLYIEMKSLRISYSYLFSCIVKRNLECRNSIFDSRKITNLISKAQERSLVWNDKYWNFDLVLHWLMNGTDQDCESVIDFLLEHEKMTNGKPFSSRNVLRYYNAPCKNLKI